MPFGNAILYPVFSVLSIALSGLSTCGGGPEGAQPTSDNPGRVVRQGACPLMKASPEGLSFRNLNTPEEFADAAERLDKTSK